MTIDTLEWLGWLVLTASVFACSMKGFLLVQAIRTRGLAEGLPDDSPEHIMAEGEVLDSIGRLAQVLLIVVVGLIWVAVISQLPDDIRGQPLRVGPVWAALAVVFVTLSLLAVVQGLRGLVYRQRLRRSLLKLRTEK